MKLHNSIFTFKKSIFTLFFILFAHFLYPQYSNDQCSGAIQLTMGSANVCPTGTFTLNTTTNDPTTTPACWNDANTDGIWYKFTATQTNAFIELWEGTGGTYTPMVAVYNGGVAPGTCPGTTATPISGGCLNYSVDYSAIELSGLIVNNVYYILCDMPASINQNFCINVYNAPPTITAGSTCPGSANATIPLTTCSDVGTPTLESNGPVTILSQAGSAAPAPVPTCGTGTGGSWVRFDLANGVTALTLNWESEFGGTAANGNGTVYAVPYQGTSCASLTQSLACVTLGQTASGSFTPSNAVIQGLDPSQDLYLYVYRSDNKAFSLPFDFVGSTTPGNDLCSAPSSSSGSTIACNLGSQGDDWSSSAATDGPEGTFAGGTSATCTGTSAWTSNENTVWYTFTANSTSASLAVSNILCNEGTSGTAQIAVFNSCACATTANYATNTCFRGCTVGTGTINLTSLTLNQTVYVAIDGNAGDVCKMDFVVNNLTPLPVTWLDFYAKKSNKSVQLFWSIEDEELTSYYQIQKSIDGGSNFYTIGSVEKNSEKNGKYQFMDETVNEKNIYYRIKEVTINGEEYFSKIIYVDFNSELSNPFVNYNNNLNQIKIQFDDKFSTEYEINLIDISGNRVNKYNFKNYDSDDKFQINTDELSKGLYFIEIIDTYSFKKTVNKVIIY